MGKFIDFVVPWNADPDLLGRSIIRSITCSRLKARKPCIILIVGDSGEGKSFTGIKIVEVVNDEFGIDTKEHLDDSMIYTPLEYVQKMNNCLYYKRNDRPDLKDLRILCIDEAREVIRARLWYTFLNQAISDCNAMSRAIKPIVLLVITQFIKDIDSSVRYTINFYGKCQRPLSGSTRFELERVWKNDYDLERPRLCKRPVAGMVRENHSQWMFRPHFQVRLPDKEIVKHYEERSFESKSKILRKKIEKTLQVLEKEMGHEFDKVAELVKYYVHQHPEQIDLIRDSKYRKFRLRKTFADMHGLTHIEVEDFEKRFLEESEKKGLCAAKQTEQAIESELYGEPTAAE